jgi:hypothetical protein
MVITRTWDDDPVILMPSIRALQAKVEEGYQAVDSRQAVRMLDGMDRFSRSQLRTFVAEARLSSFPVYSLDDHKLKALVRSCIQDGRVVAVQKGSAKTQAPGATVEHRRLVKAIDQKTHGRLHYGGRKYKLVSDIDLTKLPGRNSYDVVRQTEAKHILSTLATLPTTPADLAPLIDQAKDRLSTDWQPPFTEPSGLIMLRSSYAGYRVNLNEEPAITPSQLKKLMEEQAAAITSLEAPEFIASGSEMVALRYTFHDPNHRLTDAVLEIFPKYDRTTCIWKQSVPGKHLVEEKGSLDWNGKLDSPDKDFPDGFATLAASPYLVRLSAKDQGKTLSRETRIRVEVAEVKMTIAPIACLTKVRDQEVVRRLQPLGGTQVVPLRVKTFFVGKGTDDLGQTLDTGHQEAMKPWDMGLGPRIPLIATVLVKSSQNKPMVAGKALGKACLLWDYIEPPPASNPSIGENNNQYLLKIEQHDQAKAGPPNGRNAPLILGGKRTGKNSPRPVFVEPDGAVQGFPFKSSPGKGRFWSVFAEIHKTGDCEGQAGVVFKPSPIAGDAYKITAYVDVDGTLDLLDPIEEQAPQGQAGWFEIWREVPLVRFVRKCPGVSVKLNDIGSFTHPAYLRWLDLCKDKNEVLSKETYTTLLSNAYRNIQHSEDFLFEDFAMFPIEDQYDVKASWWGRLWGDPERIPAGEMVRFRKFDDFLDQCEAAGKRSPSKEMKQRISQWKSAGKRGYFQAISDRALALSQYMLRPLAQEDGVTAAGFDGIHNLKPLMNGITIPQFSNRARISLGLFVDRADTLAHELGHCLFLPHAPALPGSGIENVMPLRHLPGLKQCLMSYGKDRPGFCAICLLRLRGANGDHLQPKGLVP